MSEETKTEEKVEEVEAEEARPAITVKPMRIDPDLNFVETVSQWGGGDLKTCFQCATCSVICPLAPDEHPFPRKEMIWAQWGLKENLVSDPDLWLCHRCNDCSDNCPRGAQTGDVMAAMRSYAYQHHAWPGFLGRWLNNPMLLPAVLGFPFLVIALVIWRGGNLAVPMGENPALASKYWGNILEPWPWLDLTFILASIFVMLSFFMSLKNLWQGFNNSGVQQDMTPKKPLLQAGIAAVQDILFHNKFEECGAGHARKTPHMLILFGFGGLFLTTALVFIGMYVPLLWSPMGLQTPLPLGHPIKVLGNASTITILIGLGWVIARRVNPALAVTHGRNSYQDVLFLTVLTLVVLTGLFSEVFRLATMHTLAAGAYYSHLSFIFFLIFYAPFSKFAHVVYHATAVTWAHHVGRELKEVVPEPLPGSAKEEGHEAA